MKSDNQASLAEALKSVLQSQNLLHKTKERLLFNEWDKIVGKSIGNYTIPKYLDKGVLYIHATDSLWRQELIMKKDELVDVINAQLGITLIESVEIR